MRAKILLLLMIVAGCTLPVDNTQVNRLENKLDSILKLQKSHDTIFVVHNNYRLDSLVLSYKDTTYKITLPLDDSYYVDLNKKVDSILKLKKERDTLIISQKDTAFISPRDIVFNVKNYFNCDSLELYNSYKTIMYPDPPTKLIHKLTIDTGYKATTIYVNANNVINLERRDAFGAAAYRASSNTQEPSFFRNDTSLNTFLFSTTLDNKVKSLIIPLTRFYQVWDEKGGVQNGLDRIAFICSRYNIAQEKAIICLEAAQAKIVLTPENYKTAVNYAKSKGYKFKYWEVSNEPFYTSTSIANVSNYAMHQMDCYKSIKSIDSTLQVGMAVLRKSWWTDQILSLAALSYDWVAPHFYALSNYSKYTTMDLILTENYKILDEIAELNVKLAGNNGGKKIPIIDTEWRMHLHGTSVGDGLSRYDGNIIGTLHQAIRMIYYARDNYVSGACSWTWVSFITGAVFSGGWAYTDDTHTNAAQALTDNKVTYLQYLYANMIGNTGSMIVGFTGTGPAYTGKAISPIDIERGADIINTGPITPLMISKSMDGNTLYITIVNGSDTKTIPFSAYISNFKAISVSANMIHDMDTQKWWFLNDNTSFYSQPVVAYSSDVASISLPPLSVVFIILKK